MTYHADVNGGNIPVFSLPFIQAQVDLEFKAIKIHLRGETFD